MAHPVIERHLLLFKILSGAFQNHPEILIHDPAVGNGHNIVKASPLVHTKSQRAVLIFIAERKFHLISVRFPHRAFLDSFKYSFRNPVFQKFPHLGLFELQLLFVRKALVGASSALPEMRAWRRDLILRCLKDFQKPSFSFPFSHFIDCHFYFLPRNHMLHDDILLFAFHFHDSFVWKFDAADSSFIYGSFFHGSSLSCIDSQKNKAGS